MGNSSSSHINSGGASSPSVVESDEGTELQHLLPPPADTSGRISPTSMVQNSLENGNSTEEEKTAEQPEEPKKSWSRFIAPVCASLAIFWRFLMDHLPPKFKQVVAACFAHLPSMLQAAVAAVAAPGPAFLQLVAVWKGFLTLDDNNFRLQKVEANQKEMKKTLEANQKEMKKMLEANQKEMKKKLEQLLKANGGTPPDDRNTSGKNDAVSVEEATMTPTPDPKSGAAAAAPDGGGGDDDDENNHLVVKPLNSKS